MKSPSMTSRSDTYRENALLNEEVHRKAQEDKLFLILSGSISAEQLQEKCHVFLPDDYIDVTVERCIAGLCGYPLCTNEYSDEYGKRDFIIRRNRVYAIERRRNFCSDKCFEASDLILSQLSLTPPYLRDDDEIIEINIPHLDSLKGKKGDLKNIAGVNAGLDDDEVEDANPSTEDIPDTIEDFAVAGLLSTGDEAQQEQTHQNKNKNDKPKEGKNDVQDLKHKTSHKENSLQHQDDVKDSESKDDSNQLKSDSVNLDKKSKKKSKVKTKNIVTDKSKDTQIKEDNEESNNLHEEHPGLTLVKEVERYFLEWLSWDSFLVTFGDVYIKGLLNHHNLTYFEEQTPNEERDVKSPGDSLKYRLLCKRLDQQEKEEEGVVEPEGRKEKVKVKRPAKSVPDIGSLRKDVKNMSVKVSNFFSGSMDQNAPLPDAVEDDRNQGMSLPLLDQYDQTKRRYSLFMERIHKEQRDVLPTLKLRTDVVRPLVSSLVKTFSLTRDNININPLQEPLVLLAILKLLSVRYTAIKCSLEESSEEEISPRLMVYGLDDKYLDRLLLFLTEERLILAKYHLKYSINVEKGFDVPESTENVAEKEFDVPEATVNDAEDKTNKKDENNKLGAILESLATSDQSRLKPAAYSALERDFQTLCTELETLD